jgi:hypothetical protein
MPDAVSQLGSVGGITKALLNALDQVESQVAASLVGPDGKPSGAAIYMHMPITSQCADSSRKVKPRLALSGLNAICGVTRVTAGVLDMCEVAY